MTILDKIVAHKKTEVKERKELYPTKLLEQSIYFPTPTVSLKKYLSRPDKLGVIAEFKRKSPSKGDINAFASVEQISIGYMQAGASALSVLTDKSFFGGSNADLTEARKYNFCPILRKEFIIDEYQLVEAKSIGADVILLIAECLSQEEVENLAKEAKKLGLEVLLEIHSEEQLDKVNQYIDVVGVNNRNLKDFTVSIQTSIDLYSKIPNDFVKISESGISNANAIVELRQVGFQGFLIGEYFMKSANPPKTCRELIRKVIELENMLQGAIA